MLKFMAWERSFEARVLKVRAKELKYQKLNYTIEVLWNAIWNGSPMLVTLVSFWHYAVVRKEVLTPATAFTSMRSSLPVLTFILILCLDHQWVMPLIPVLRRSFYLQSSTR